MTMYLDEEAPQFDPDARRLCGDPACLGVIGDDGHCSECRRLGDGEEPRKPSTALDAGEPAGPSDAQAVEASATDQAADPKADSADGAASEADSLDDRQLCSDPGCIGVFNAEGRCSECGRLTSPS